MTLRNRNGPARPMAAAAGPRCRRCAGQARGGRPVTGRGARTTGIRRQEAQSEQAGDSLGLGSSSESLSEHGASDSAAAESRV